MSQAGANALQTPGAAGSPLLLGLAVVVLAAAFFFSWHDWRSSRHQAEQVEGIDAEVSVEEAASEGSLARRLAYPAIGLLGLGFLVLRGGRPLHLRGLLPVLLLLYVLWCLTSIFWSVDVSLTSRRLVIFLCCVVGAVGVARQLTARELCLLALAVTTAYLALGVVAELALGTFRPLSSEYQFAGTAHPNQQGTSCAVLCLAAFCAARSRQQGKALLLALLVAGGIFLLLTKSRTSCVALLVTLILLFAVKASARANVVGAVGLAWALSGIALAVCLFELDRDQRLADLLLLARSENAGSLSGRLPLWTELVTRYLTARPVLGYGYGGFWNPQHLWALATVLDWDVPDAHSVYLETALNVGLVGTALLVSVVVLGLRRAAVLYRATDDPGHGLTFALLVYGVVEGVAEAGFVLPTFYAFVAACGLAQMAFFRSEEMTAPSGEAGALPPQGDLALTPAGAREKSS
jgi:O-antigen ligase